MFPGRPMFNGQSQDFCRSKGLPVFDNVLFPRYKGFDACIQALRGSHIQHVYGFTPLPPGNDIDCRYHNRILSDDRDSSNLVPDFLFAIHQSILQISRPRPQIPDERGDTLCKEYSDKSYPTRQRGWINGLRIVGLRKMSTLGSWRSWDGRRGASWAYWASDCFPFLLHGYIEIGDLASEIWQDWHLRYMR